MIAALQRYSRMNDGWNDNGVKLGSLRKIRRKISEQNHKAFYIAAKTELSKAKQSQAGVYEVIFGNDDPRSSGEKVRNLDDRLNDLLKFIDLSLSNLREVRQPSVKPCPN